MLDPTNDKGGLAEEARFQEDFPCMVHDDQGYDGEYRCGFRRFDVKSGYRPSTGNVSVAALEFLLQERSGVTTVARIEGTWCELGSRALIESKPRLLPRKPGWSDTDFFLAHQQYWKAFQHVHDNSYRAQTRSGDS